MNPAHNFDFAYYPPAAGFFEPAARPSTPPPPYWPPSPVASVITISSGPSVPALQAIKTVPSVPRVFVFPPSPVQPPPGVMLQLSPSPPSLPPLEEAVVPTFSYPPPSPHTPPLEGGFVVNDENKPSQYGLPGAPRKREGSPLYCPLIEHEAVEVVADADEEDEEEVLLPPDEDTRELALELLRQQEFWTRRVRR